MGVKSTKSTKSTQSEENDLQIERMANYSQSQEDCEGTEREVWKRTAKGLLENRKRTEREPKELPKKEALRPIILGP